MSSLSTGSWFDAEAQSFRDILDEYGEWFTLTPFTVKRINFPAELDNTRAPCEFRAVYDRQGKHVKLGMQEVEISTRDPCITALVCDIPYAVGQGDRLTHKLTGEVFEVKDAIPDGLSGVEIKVVQLGRAAR